MNWNSGNEFFPFDSAKHHVDQLLRKLPMKFEPFELCHIVAVSGAANDATGEVSGWLNSCAQ